MKIHEIDTQKYKIILNITKALENYKREFITFL
nr:MAG TPA: hypothetical protein [Inoviridae sp.]